MGWGVHDYPEPPELDMPRCPECGEECEILYRNRIGEIVGCDNCLEQIDAYYYTEEE